MPKGQKKPKPKPAPKPKGTRDLYRPEYDAIVGNLVRLTGATISEVAEILNVSIATIYNWQARQESFRLALRVPENIANNRVELSCYNEAVGYFVEEEEIKVIDGKVLKVKKKVWMRPNPTTIIWWTKVKAGWQPKEEIPQAPVDDGAATIDNSPQRETDKQIARRLAFIIHKGGLEEDDAA